MYKEIYFSSGIIDGDSMRRFLEIISASPINFKQRKTYDEYYWDSFSWVFTLEEFDKLSQAFTLGVTSDSIIVEL